MNEQEYFFMGKTLVLAEKPSVGKELARVLGCHQGGNGYLEGPRYVVTWALGHLVTLADPEAYEKAWQKWDMDTLPMLPQNMKLVVIPESAKQFKIVQSQMKRNDISELVIATDAGREGELVARWIMQKAGWNRPTMRLWISSQTDRAIRDGFAHLRPAREYDALYRSAQARSEADWLVGLNVTRALTCRHNAQLSAGRVQTPTLALITQREEEIRSFRPRDFWTIRLKIGGFSVLWKDSRGQSRIFDENQARTLAKSFEGRQGVITQVNKQYKQVPPPPAYDLTELQRDANRKYAYSAKETLNLMQSLYERHKLLTYPRTDSRYISDDVVPTLPERLRSVMVGEYADLARQIIRTKPLQTRYLVNNAKVTDHHAIIPTEEQPELWRLSGPEKNIYDLVVRRFLAVLLPPHTYEEISLTVQVDGQQFTAKGKAVRDQGWKAAYDQSYAMDEDEGEETDRQNLPQLTRGQRLPVETVQVVPGKTTPPARYTEATLLTAMEHPQVEDKAMAQTLAQTSGLGTPATRADIIEKLFSSFYIERRGKELVPTAKGLQLVKLVPEELRSAVLTAKWEDRLAAIAQGKSSDRGFVGEMRQFASRLVDEVKTSSKTYTHENMTRTPCPDCGKNLLRVKTKNGGEMLVCPDRECGYRRSTLQITIARCPNCHKKLELRGEGEKQMFACVCGYREKMSAFKERRAQSSGNKNDVRNYLARQEGSGQPKNTPMAEQLAKWLENNQSQGK